MNRRHKIQYFVAAAKLGHSIDQIVKTEQAIDWFALEREYLDLDTSIPIYGFVRGASRRIGPDSAGPVICLAKFVFCSAPGWAGSWALKTGTRLPTHDFKTSIRNVFLSFLFGVKGNLSLLEIFSRGLSK